MNTKEKEQWYKLLAENNFKQGYDDNDESSDSIVNLTIALVLSVIMLLIVNIL